MVSPDQLAASALTSVLIIAVPGPSVLFVIGRALAHGRTTALASVLGNTLVPWGRPGHRHRAGTAAAALGRPAGGREDRRDGLLRLVGRARPACRRRAPRHDPRCPAHR